MKQIWTLYNRMFCYMNSIIRSVVKIKTSHPTYENLTTDATFIMNGME